MARPDPRSPSWPTPHLGVSAIVGIAVLAVLWTRSFGGGPVGVRTAAGLAACTYLSIAGHELGHAAAARAAGADVHRLTVNALGGWTEYDRAGATPGREALIAAAGPAVNVALALTAAALSQVGGWFGALATAVAGTNLLLALLNLIPVAPLDGGTLLAAVLWRATGSHYRGVAAAAWAGRVAGVAVAGSPFLLVAFGRPVSAPSAVSTLLFGTFLFAAATARLYAARVEAHTSGMTAADVCQPGPGPEAAAVTVRADTPLVDVAAQVPPGAVGDVVDGDGNRTGWVHGDDVAGRLRAAASTRPQ